jgi:ribonuclease HI
MYFDGSLMKTGADAWLLFISPLGVHLRYVVRLHFATSNNVAEYEALVNGLHIAIELGVRCLDVRGDSQLIIDQVMKNSSCYDARMEAYYEEVWRLEDKFFGLELNHVAQRYNEVADELAKIASGRTTVPQTSLPGTSSNPRWFPRRRPSSHPHEETLSTDGPEAMQIDDEGDRAAPASGWRAPYLEYLLRGELSLGKTKARRLACWAKIFVLIGEEKELYRCSPSGILQRYIPINQGHELLGEIHSRACGHHVTPRTLVDNAFMQGFY